MTWVWATPGGWLLRSALGGGLLLLFACMMMRRARQPARRQRLGEWGLVAAILLAFLSLGPGWIGVPGLVSEPASPPEAVSCHPPSPLPSQASANERSRSFVASVPRSENEGQESASQFFPGDDREAFALLPHDLHAEPPIEQANSPAKTPLKGIPAVTSKDEQSKSATKNAMPHEEEIASGVWFGVRSGIASLPALFPWLIAAYAVGAAFFLGRWLLGYLALWRLLRSARPAPRYVARLFGEMVGEWRIKPRLLVSSRLRVPLSCGLLRPVVVLPASLCELPSVSPPNLGGRYRGGRLHWVFAHELTHLERRDAWACMLFGLGQALYFYWPWFWWLRRQVRLCQEYIADAAVVRETGQAEDYAEFLLSLSTAPAVPVSATGVMGNSSDLFRRVTMLLQTPHRVDKCCPWRWTLAVAGALLALAVIVAGIGPQAQANDKLWLVAFLDTGTVEAADAKAASVTNPALDNKKDDSNQDKEEPSKDKQKKKPARATPPADEDKPQPAPGQFPGGQPPAGFDQQRMMQQMMQRMMQKGMMPGGIFGHHARLGVQVSKPSEALVDQLDLPKDQGQVVEQVVPDSPAAKAGLKPHDILLELGGKAVPADYQEFVKEVQDIKADAKVDAVVLRKGKKETVKGITLPEAKQEAFPGFPPAGRGGFGQGQAPAFPQFAPGNFPQPRLGVGNAFQPGENTVMTTMFRTKDSFTTRHQEGSLIITLTGKVADGKTKLGEIQVQDGQVVHKYESVDKVPDQYQDKVKNLVEMSEKSSLRIEVKTP